MEVFILLLSGLGLVLSGPINGGSLNWTTELSQNISTNLLVNESPIKFDNRSRMSNGLNWVNCRHCGLVHRNRIVGGRKALINEYPWTVSIHKSGIQHCGASVIDNMHVLTAAHCVVGVNPSQLTIIGSATNVFDDRAFRAQIRSFITHPLFEPNTYDYDIALLTLNERIPLSESLIRPICLPEPDDDPTGGSGVVSGWGALKETANVAPEEMRQVELPIVSNAQCHQAQGLKDQKVTERMMCAGFLQGHHDACSGDSGGPLAWHYNGRWKQVGIVSWGIGCARPQYYGVFTKVTAMLPWIAANIQNAGCY